MQHVALGLLQGASSVLDNHRLRLQVQAMPDWSQITIQDFDAQVRQPDPISVITSRLVLERLPFTFDTKLQFLTWKNELATGLAIDPRDIVVIGSAGTGRSLNPHRKFGVFHKQSDIDIAVISDYFFDTAWRWFRSVNPILLSLDDRSRHIFERHRTNNIFEGYIAAEVFLGYLPFGSAWMSELQRSARFLPADLHGRKMSIRLYRDGGALRRLQENSIRLYRKYLGIFDTM